MSFNRWIVMISTMVLISEFAVATTEEESLLPPYRRGVPSTFFGSDENLLPEDMKRFEEGVSEVIRVLGDEAATPGGFFTLQNWRACLTMPDYVEGEAPYTPPATDGMRTSTSLHPVRGTPIHYRVKIMPMTETPADFVESEPHTEEPKQLEEINGSLFEALDTEYNFLHFMPLISDKNPISYGAEPYKTYIHQGWVGITSDPSLVLTSHHAGPCILFGVRNTVTGKRALFHTMSHLRYFSLALYLIQELADGPLGNLDIKMACAMLTPTSLAFVSGLNKIMAAHGVENFIPLHVYPVAEVGAKKYYRGEDVRANAMGRQEPFFTIGMTVSKEGFEIFDSEDAYNVFPSFGLHDPYITSRPTLLAMRPASASKEDWDKHVEIFTYDGPNLDGRDVATHTPNLIRRKI